VPRVDVTLRGSQISIPATVPLVSISESAALPFVSVSVGSRVNPAAIARVAAVPTPAIPTAAPEQYIHGLLIRDPAQANAGALARSNGIVHEMMWSAAQPNSTDQGTIVAAAVADLDDTISLATSNGLDFVRIRPFAGRYAPTWVKNLGAGPLNNWVDPVDGGTFTIPAWWDTVYLDAYEDFMDSLATVIATRDNVVDVAISGGSSVYAEPLIHQFSNSTNRTTAVAAGFTNAADWNAQTRCVDIHQEHITPTGRASLFSVNPWQTISGSGGISLNTQWTIDLLDYIRETMGLFGIWQNNSIASSVSGGTYPSAPGTYTSERGTSDSHYSDIYDHMAAVNGSSSGTVGGQATSIQHPVTFQTATLTKITGSFAPATPRATAEWVDYVIGGTAVEMPNGWQTDTYCTVAQASTLNAQFAANAALLG
jgi:hypothetical protein